MISRSIYFGKLNLIPWSASDSVAMPAMQWLVLIDPIIRNYVHKQLKIMGFCTIVNNIINNICKINCTWNVLAKYQLTGHVLTGQFIYQTS